VPERLIPVGVRLPESIAAHMDADESRKGSSRSAKVRAIVEAHYENRPSGNVKPDSLPELMGTKEASAELGTTTSNLGKIAGLPEPLYGPKHPNPRRRISAGSLYDAAAIRELAEARRSARGTLLESVN
jgi:hypothetical protein